MTASFIKQIRASIAFWQQHLEWGNDDVLTLVDERKKTVWQTIAWGKMYPETFYETAELVADLYPLIERRNYWEEWIPEIASFTSQLDRSDPLYLRLENQRGCLYRLMGRLDESQSIHQATLDCAKEAGNLYEMAESEMYLSIYAYRASNYEDAILHGVRAGETFGLYQEEGNDVPPRKWGAVYNILGLAYQDVGEKETALAYMKKAVDAYAQTEDYSYLATVQLNYALLLEDNKAFGEAEVAIREAIVSAELSQNINKLAHALAIHGDILRCLNRFEEAEAVLHRANDEKLERSSDEWVKGTVKAIMGNVYLAWGKPNLARQWLDESVAHWDKTEDQTWTANAYFALAKAQVELGDLEGGVRSAEIALTLLAPFTETDRWRNMHAELAQLIADHS